MKSNSTDSNIATATDWNDYSRSFQSVMPSQMLALNREVAAHMKGHVVDFGCGGGKIIPFVLDSPDVTGYTGIDAAAEMVDRARWMGRQFVDKPSRIVHGRIEEVVVEKADTALSINSFYNWPDTRLVLEKIAGLLKPGAVFVLATINDRLDMPALLDRARMECVAHPHWPEFCEHNVRICKSSSIQLLSLDELIREVQAAGFVVEEAHQKLYDGGLSLLVLTSAGGAASR